MKMNIGTADRIIRVLLSLAIFWLSITGILTGLVALVLSAVASVLVLTVSVSFCPIYFPFGLSTAKKKD